MNTKEQVRAYLAKVLGENVGDDDSLVASGRLSSLDVVDTLLFLEGRFGFSIDPSDFDPMKFDTINAMVSLIDPQTGPRGPGPIS